MRACVRMRGVRCSQDAWACHTRIAACMRMCKAGACDNRVLSTLARKPYHPLSLLRWG
jgi:hypothetical protein